MRPVTSDRTSCCRESFSRVRFELGPSTCQTNLCSRWRIAIDVPLRGFSNLVLADDTMRLIDAQPDTEACGMHSREDQHRLVGSHGRDTTKQHMPAADN